MTEATATNLRDACLSYLEDKHCTLWADFEIQSPDRREVAADWLADQIMGVMEHGREEMLRN